MLNHPLNLRKSHQNAINEVWASHLEARLYPAIITTGEDKGLKACKSGFYDPEAREGNGLVGVFDQDSRELIFRVVSDGNGSFLNSIKPSSCLPAMEGLSHFITSVHVIRKSMADYYLAYSPEDKKLSISSVAHTQNYRSSSLAPVTLIIGSEGHLPVTHAATNIDNDGVVVTLAEGLILDIKNKAFGLSDNHPGFRLDLRECSGDDCQVVGFMGNEDQSWMDVADLEQTIDQQLMQLPQESWHKMTLLPIYNYAPADFYSEDSQNSENSDRQPLSGWYIHSLKRVYFASGHLSPIGFDLASRAFYALDRDSKKVVVARMSQHASSDSRAYFPVPEIYNQKQLEYRFLQLKSGILYGTDAVGRIFQLGRSR